MALAVSLLLFALLMGAITYYGYRLYVRPGRLYDQVGGQATTAAMPGSDQPGRVVRVLQQVGETAAPIDPTSMSLGRRMLVAAGYRSEWAPAAFMGFRVLLAGLLLLIALVLRASVSSSPILGIVFLIAAALLGFFGPSFWLEHRVSSRQESLRFALPDALDLLVVGVEAGLGLDQAMSTVARELADAHPDLAEELNLVHLEMRAGTSRAQALKNLSRRTGERSIRQLVGIMVQSDRFGTSMAEALRTHADFLRIRRRQEAEERANKVGVKLVFPIFFFILPSMLVVAAGSGVLQLVKHLFPLMNSFDSRI